jgi:hypothetical protein
MVESETRVTINRLKLLEPLTNTPILSCVGGVVTGPLNVHPEVPGHGLGEDAWLISAIQTVPPMPTVTVVVRLNIALVPVIVAGKVPRVEPEAESVEVAVP